MVQLLQFKLSIWLRNTKYYNFVGAVGVFSRNKIMKMSDKLVLYHLHLSPPTRTVKIVAKLLGLELDLRYIKHFDPVWNNFRFKIWFSFQWHWSAEQGALRGPVYKGKAAKTSTIITSFTLWFGFFRSIRSEPFQLWSMVTSPFGIVTRFALI